MILPYLTGMVTVTSPFGSRILNGAYDYHSGVDLVGTDKTLVAPCNGTVLVSQMVTDKTNRTWEWGNYVCIQAENGLLVYMCHMSERLVSVGQNVSEGDVIGIEGDTGYSFGSHCHFEMREGTNSINPCDNLGINNLAGEQYFIVRNTMKHIEGTHDWSEDAVRWAIENGILYGDENGDLMLEKPCTREQMVVFLKRLHDLLRGII